MFDASSEARNSTVFATCSGLPKRPSGMVFATRASKATIASGVGAARFQIGVLVPPGARARPLRIRTNCACCEAGRDLRLPAVPSRAGTPACRACDAGPSWRDLRRPRQSNRRPRPARRRLLDRWFVNPGLCLWMRLSAVVLSWSKNYIQLRVLIDRYPFRERNSRTHFTTFWTLIRDLAVTLQHLSI